MRKWRKRGRGVSKEEGEQLMLDIFTIPEMTEEEKKELDEDIKQLRQILSMRKHPSYKRSKGES